LKVLLLQLDGKIPNIALMRIAAHHRALGDEVSFRVAGNERAIHLMFWESPDRIYASAIFSRTRPLAERLWDSCRTSLFLGGTGWDIRRSLEDIGITTTEQDYAIYPHFRQSLGFTQRGCRLSCSFCVVPQKEGKVRAERGIHEIWRGDPWPRELLLLDNDFFGQAGWRKHITDIREGNFKVSFNQGINARCLTEEAAEAIASVDYRDDSMKTKRIYTAWDSREDEERLFAGLNRLVKYGVKPDHIMVYMLVGYWPNETAADREYRRMKLREFGARPYPMPYVRTPELRGFQRWIIGAYDKRIPWKEWEEAKYEPRNLHRLTGRDPVGSVAAE
jgi:hypothetical protein